MRIALCGTVGQFPALNLFLREPVNPTTVRVLAVALGLGFATSAARAQQTPVAAAPAPQVGTMAPDFTIPGATRYGMLENPVRLSDFRGKTVVLAFFIRARTKG
jgi:thioredoxin-dependent peroxiredoxin